MAEYINREELLKDINDSVRFSTRNGVSAELRGAHKIVDRIRSATACDVVKVVRCSECKHRHDPMRCALWYGTMGDNEYFLEHGKNFYCAFGERRSENDKSPL